MKLKMNDINIYPPNNKIIMSLETEWKVSMVTKIGEMNDIGRDNRDSRDDIRDAFRYFWKTLWFFHPSHLLPILLQMGHPGFFVYWFFYLFFTFLWGVWSSPVWVFQLPVRPNLQTLNDAALWYFREETKLYEVTCEDSVCFCF